MLTFKICNGVIEPPIVPENVDGLQSVSGSNFKICLEKKLFAKVTASWGLRTFSDRISLFFLESIRLTRRQVGIGVPIYLLIIPNIMTLHPVPVGPEIISMFSPDPGQSQIFFLQLTTT